VTVKPLPIHLEPEPGRLALWLDSPTVYLTKEQAISFALVFLAWAVRGDVDASQERVGGKGEP